MSGNMNIICIRVEGIIMRILFIIHNLKYGGPSNQAINMKIQLEKKGHSVHLYGLTKKNSGFFRSFITMIECYSPLKKHLEKNDYDILQAFDTFFSGILVLKLGKKYKKPIVLRIGTVVEDFYLARFLSKFSNKITHNFFKKNRLIRMFLFFITVSIFNRFNIVVFNSYFLQNKYEKWLQRKSVVIWNGVDIFSFKKMENSNVSREQKLNILFVGRIEPRKGIESLIKYSYILSKSNQNFHLNIIGGIEDSKYFSKINVQIKRLNLNNFFTFTGMIPHKDLNKIYSENDLLLFPTNSMFFPITEGLPNVILEALSVGLPIIATNVAGVNEIIENGKNGFIIEEGNHNELIDNVKLLLDNQELRMKMSTKNRNKAIEKFSFEVCIEKYILIFEEIRK